MRQVLLSAILACLCASAAQGALIIYYPLDETSGNVAFDAAIADGSQNATSASVADWQGSAGIIGGAIQLSPTGQTDVNEALIYNTASTATSLLTGPPFTITLWFKTTNTIPFNRMAAYLGDSTATDRYYSVGLTPTHQPVQVARNGSAINNVATGTANDGEWHQMTAVYTAANNRSLYIDGRLSGTSTTNVTNMILNRFGVGALTRSSQTDAFGGLLDEVGLWDAAFSPQQAALLNAFPRYDEVRLDDSDYALALSVFQTQSGSVDTGDWTWSFATGLPGTTGSTGFADGNPYVVLDNAGNGLAAIPEPGVGALALAGFILCARRRRK